MWLIYGTGAPKRLEEIAGRRVVSSGAGAGRCLSFQHSALPFLRVLSAPSLRSTTMRHLLRVVLEIVARYDDCHLLRGCVQSLGDLCSGTAASNFSTSYLEIGLTLLRWGEVD